MDYGVGEEYWKVEEVPIKPGYFTIRSMRSGGSPSCTSYITAGELFGDWDHTVWLMFRDDFSGAQHWRIPGLKGNTVRTVVRNVKYDFNNAVYGS